MMDMDKQENQCNILSCRSGTVGTWGCSPCIKFSISIPSYDNCVTVGVLRYEGILGWAPLCFLWAMDNIWLIKN